MWITVSILQEFVVIKVRNEGKAFKPDLACLKNFVALIALIMSLYFSDSVGSPMFSVGIDKVLSQLDVCAWLVLAFETRVKGFSQPYQHFLFFFSKCELNLTSPAPSVLGHKL